MIGESRPCTKNIVLTSYSNVNFKPKFHILIKLNFIDNLPNNF